VGLASLTDQLQLMVDLKKAHVTEIVKSAPLNIELTPGSHEKSTHQ